MQAALSNETNFKFTPIQPLTHFDSEIARLTGKRKLSAELIDDNAEEKTKKQRTEIVSIPQRTLGETFFCLTQHLEYPLSENGFNKATIANVIANIGIVIFDLNQNPSEYSQRIQKIENHDLNLNDGLDITFHVECLLDTILKKIERIKIHLYFPKEIPCAKVGQGALKKIKNSFTLIFPKGEIQAIQIIPSVVQRTLDETDDQDIIDLHQGIKIQSFLNSILDSEHKLAADPGFRIYTNKQGNSRVEFEQEWYNGDLQHLFDGLPLARNLDSQLIKANIHDFFDILINLSETPHITHENGFVHGEGKEKQAIFRYIQIFDVNIFRCQKSAFWDFESQKVFFSRNAC